MGRLVPSIQLFGFFRRLREAEKIKRNTYNKNNLIIQVYVIIKKVHHRLLLAIEWIPTVPPEDEGDDMMQHVLGRKG